VDAENHVTVSNQRVRGWATWRSAVRTRTAWSPAAASRLAYLMHARVLGWLRYSPAPTPVGEENCVIAVTVRTTSPPAAGGPTWHPSPRRHRGRHAASTCSGPRPVRIGSHHAQPGV